MNLDFSELSLSEPLVRALQSKGYTKPTPIQVQTIPEVLNGRDILATAQTGTGKTASFSLPILQMLANHKNLPFVKALILTPTRELAEQINRNIQQYSKNIYIPSAVLVGGVSMQSQIKQLSKKPAIVVATPGRLIDLINQKKVSLSHVQTLVLDEADRMLDMGFINDVKRIAKLTPQERQTLLFSATMSKKVAELAKGLLRDPKRIEIAPESTVADNLEQSVYFVEQSKKSALLVKTLKALNDSRVLVFTRTKFKANKLAEQLERNGISADAIHSNKSQSARRKTLAAFDKGKVNVLVATDVVARGIDVKEITHVINYELPDDPENYVHRIGRTARAKKSGIAYTFCSDDEIATLRTVERMTKQKLTVTKEQPFHSENANNKYLKAMTAKSSPKSSSRKRRGNRSNKRSFGPRRNRGSYSRRSARE